MGNIWRKILIACMVAVVFTVLQVVAMRFINPPRTMVMLLRSFEAWQHNETHYQLRYRWCDDVAMAPSIARSLIAAEDQHFMDHHGFDIQAISRAQQHNAHAKVLWGASTISQQVAKNVFLWQGRSWIRKGLEAWYTVWIELLWSKRRILEVYANVAEFGQGIYGVQAAANQFWQQDAATLSSQQAALLAAVLPAPGRLSASHPSRFVWRRAAWIEQQARRLGRSQVPLRGY